jgi:hypothetical protein
MMGSVPTVEIPRANEFVQAAKFGTTRSPQEFLPHALTILGHTFPLGCFPYQHEGKTTIITTYRILDRLPPNLSGEMAVMIEFSVTDKDSMQFSLKSDVLESRSHSRAWKKPESPEIVNAAAALSDQLRQELEQ